MELKINVVLQAIIVGKLLEPANQINLKSVGLFYKVKIRLLAAEEVLVAVE